MIYSEIQGWTDFESAYSEMVDRLPDGAVIVEVGTYLGRSLVFLATLVKNSGKRIRVVGVDTCRGSGPEGGDSTSIPRDHHGEAVKRGGGTFAGELHRNLIDCGVADYVTLIVGDSKTAATLFPDESVDFCFLDAAHDYENVKDDILHWITKIKPGGVLGGDDLCPGIWDGVVQAVEELLPGFTPWSHDSWKYVVPPEPGK